MKGPKQNSKYWTSLEDRRWRAEGLPSPAAEREFAPGALDPPSEVSRRSVLKLMGASAALAGVGVSCRPVEHIVPYVEAPEGIIPGIPQRYATTLTRGQEAIGVLVEVHEGRPNKVEGNALHPGSLGAASAQVQASVLDLYDPDRAVGFRHQGERSDREAFAAAWSAVRDQLPADGQGLAVLAEGHCSPTLTELERRFASAYPAARWVTWDAVGDGNALDGLGGHRVVHHLEAARVVATFDCDLLHAESGGLAHAREWSATRSALDDSMSRLYAIESCLTPTGAVADHRLPVSSGRIGTLLAALARELGVEASALGAPTDEESGRMRRLADDLRRAGAAALVAVGRSQPPAVHALAYAVNQALGSVGTTLSVHPATDVAWGRDEELAGLVEAMKTGEVQVLVVLGGNPVYGAPGSLGFAEALAGLPDSVHLGACFDETSAICGWHVPQTHAFEAWGDARALDGRASVVQPLIEPLHGGVSTIELLGLMLDGAWSDGLEVVRSHWEQALGIDAAGWNRVLHDGVWDDEGLAVLDPSAVGVDLEVIAAPAAGLELTWRPSATTWDGRYANNAWLQEAPDPISKLSWDNAALVSPGLAERLDLQTQDRITLRREGVEVVLPVVVLPGQAEESIAVELGFGRRHVGRVGDGVGIDINPLRSLGPNAFVGGVEVEKVAAGADSKLVFSQEHWNLEGRPLIRAADLEEYRQHPDFAQEVDAELEFVELYPRFDYSEGPQWGMTIDLNACTGCMACVTACQSENNIPVVGKEQIDRGREMLWLRVDRYFAGEPANPRVEFQPVPCMHCENAPCEQVCPVAATVHNPAGLNLMVYNRCIGTRYCSNNCPYKVRRFNFFNFTKDTPELTKMAMNPDVTVRSRGVMEKCTYCIQRISEAEQTARRDGRDLADGDVVTACQQTCPTQAITFGDLRLEGSQVAQLKESPRNYTILTELANFPRTSYLAPIRNPNPDWEEA